MTFHKTSGKVYYSSNIFKSTHDNVDEFKTLSFQDVRNTPILNKASDYEMSILKFSCDTCSVPIHIAKIVPNQADPWKTILSVNISYLTGGTETFLAAPISVIHTQRDFTDFDPAPPNTNTNGIQSFTRAYYCYSYTDVLEDVNTALVAAKTALDVLFPALASYEPPSLSWDSALKKADLHCRQDIYSEGLASQIRIHFSKSLYPLFSSFPVIKSKVTADRVEYRIRTYDFGINQEPLFYGINTALKVSQEYTTIELWTPFSSIAFASNLLPVQTEQIAPPQVYIDGELTNLYLGTNNFFPIIGDITSQDDSYRSNILYVPSAENVMISLFGDQPLYKLDFSVYLQLKTGQFIPFSLHANSHVMLKLLFSKKD